MKLMIQDDVFVVYCSMLKRAFLSPADLINFANADRAEPPQIQCPDLDDVREICTFS